MIQPSLAGLVLFVEGDPALASAQCAEACWATFKRPCGTHFVGRERLPELGVRGEGNQPSSGAIGEALGSFRSGSLPELALHRSDHFIRRVEGPEGPAFFEIVLGLSQTSINNPALLGGVLVIGSREFGAVGHELGRQYNLATAY